MNKLKRNLVYQIVYRLLTIVTPFITAPILARSLGAGNLGIFSATYAYVNYFMLFSMLGIENYGNRAIASALDEDSRQKIFWEIYAVQFVTSMLSIAFYIASVFLLVPQNRFDFAIAQGIWLVSCVFDINWFFFGIEKFSVTVLRNCVVKVVTVVMIVSFVQCEQDLLKYIVIMACGTMLSQMVLWINLRKHIRFVRPTFQGLARHIKPILLLFIPILAISIYHIMDKSMLDYFSTDTEVGFYYSADKIVSIPLGLISAVSTVVLPRMSALIGSCSEDEANTLLEKGIELVAFLICGVGFGIAAISKEFVPAFYGSGYEKCILLVYFFVPVLIAKALGEAVRSQFLIPRNKDKIYIIAVVTGAFTNFIVNILLIPRFDSLGAVVGTFIAEAVVLFVQMFGSIGEYNFFAELMKQKKYFIAGVIMLFSIREVVRLLAVSPIATIALSVILGAIIYLTIILIIFKESLVSKSFVKMMQQIVKK